MERLVIDRIFPTQWYAPIRLNRGIYGVRVVCQFCGAAYHMEMIIAYRLKFVCNCGAQLVIDSEVLQWYRTRIREDHPLLID